MFFVQPLPDEFVGGHFGRLGRVNGYNSSLQLIRELDECFRSGAKDWEPPSVDRLITTHLGMESEAYLQKHTMLPFYWVTTFEREEPRKFESVAKSRQRAALKHERDAAYFCDECVKSDKRDLGFSYWRRFHQLPGVDTCSIHRTALRYIHKQNAFDEPPQRWSAIAETVSKELAELQCHPVISRYTKISSRFLNQQRQCRYVASAFHSASARQMGLKVVLRGSATRISDRMQQELPSLWLSTHWPELAKKQERVLFSALDGVIGSQVCTGLAHALTLALCHDDADYAVSKFFELPLDQHKVSFPKKVIMRSDMQNAYLQCEGNFSAMSKFLEKDMSTVTRHMKKAGVPSAVLLNEAERHVIFEIVRDADIFVKPKHPSKEELALEKDSRGLSEIPKSLLMPIRPEMKVAFLANQGDFSKMAKSLDLNITTVINHMRQVGIPSSRYFCEKARQELMEFVREAETADLRWVRVKRPLKD
ncbi:TniQ family protein [Iodobacter ciconiae]|uniref:TniQ domain-containing protein n=1 Tax=Iodobacter ciconiae TaxID=2496266 RepID=A0A3S8ZWZ2_9NEIS|nr:TniQ family protein [Iodobacter ciconiae]AZN38003.1 hypothetical protein EJO50_16950 [Iodobacter ciconiae]